jgi:hypothetical protein
MTIATIVLQPDTLTTLAVSIAAVVTLFVQVLKDLFVDPNMPDNRQRVGLLWLLTYLFNFGLLVLALVLKDAWDPANLIGYLALAFGQALGSGGAYNVLNKSIKAKVAQNDQNVDTLARRKTSVRVSSSSAPLPPSNAV